jgi:hypothetical protein
VTIRGNPPAAGTVHTCGRPLRFETKAIAFPSGEKLGERQNPTRDMRETAVSRSSAARGSDKRREIDERKRDPGIFLRK